MFFGVGAVGRQSIVGKRGMQGATLDLDFMSPGVLDPRITFTRAGVGTYFDATGTLQTATTNTPRWDYNPATHVLNGLLLEQIRTNLLLNSATLNTQSVTVTAQTYTLSFYGTGTITLSGTSSGSLVGTGAAQRVSTVFTPTAGSLTCTVTGTVTNAQLEAGTYATAYIATAGASATRVTELCTIPLAAWFNASASTMVAEYMLGQSPSPAGSPNRDICCISDLSGNRLVLRGPAPTTSVNSAVTFVSGGSQTPPTVGPISANAPMKLGASWDGVNCNCSLNGGAVASYAFGMPAGLTTLTFGNQFSGASTFLNGWIRRFRYWPRALSAAELQSVTT